MLGEASGRLSLQTLVRARLVEVLYLRATVALVLPILVDVIVPAVLLSRPGGRFELSGGGIVGLPLLVAGCWLLLDCVFLRFAHEGRGTLAPVDPPRFVVRGGAYRVVRNPMYIANVAIIIGSGLLLRSWRLLAWSAVVLVAFHVFVVAYEEPTLRRSFGETYEAYRRDVGRWTPRWRPRS
jgi:protein-S-isoprenylcysteine O-methyltransferase Ste14